MESSTGDLRVIDSTTLSFPPSDVSSTSLFLRFQTVWIKHFFNHGGFILRHAG